jgi:predicted adenylyl cyclase CyaB
MPRNVELKAPLADYDRAMAVARELATEHVGHEHQVDTYFKVATGRLKLREIEGGPPRLVWYERADFTGARTSNYLLVPVEQPELLRQALAGALGVLAIVDKEREIFLYQNVRIHLDRVAGLGDFVEFEAVLSAEISEEVGHRQVGFLCERFAISPESAVAGSYSDCLIARNPQN